MSSSGLIEYTSTKLLFDTTAEILVNMTNMEMCDGISFQTIVQHVTLICRNYCSPYIAHVSVSGLHVFGGSDPYSLILLLIRIFLQRKCIL